MIHSRNSALRRRQSGISFRAGDARCDVRVAFTRVATCAHHLRTVHAATQASLRLPSAHTVTVTCIDFDELAPSLRRCAVAST